MKGGRDEKREAMKRGRDEKRDKREMKRGTEMER